MATIQKKAGKLWFNLAIPAVGSETTIGADGTPDAVENPNAKWVGETDQGIETSVTKEITQEVVDDYKQPLDTTVEQVGMALRAALVVKTLDIDVLEMATSGVGKKQTVSGKTKITYGEQDITYTCAAVIYPTAADSTKFACFQIYSGYNTAPVDRQVSRQNRMVLPIEIIGLAIQARPAEDRIGQEWKQT